MRRRRGPWCEEEEGRRHLGVRRSGGDKGDREKRKKNGREKSKKKGKKESRATESKVLEPKR